MQNLAYVTTYCTKNEHNSSITFLALACSRKCVTDGWIDMEMNGQTRHKTIVAIWFLWAEAINNTFE